MIGWICTICGCLDLAGAINDAPHSPWLAELTVGLILLAVGGRFVLRRRV
jgi:hypothetical protein